MTRAQATDPEQRWTDRLHLRALTELDVVAVAALEHEAGITASPDQARARDHVQDWASDGMGGWALEHNGRLVGVAGLRFLTFHLRSTWDLRVCITPSGWGRGYALEAVQEALVVAQEHSSRMPVIARTRLGATHAFDLAERAGLVRRKDLDRDDLEVHVTHW